MITGIAKKVRRLLSYMQAVRGRLIITVLAMALGELSATWMVADLLGNGMFAMQTRDIDALWMAILQAIPWLILILALGVISHYLSGVATATATAALRRHLFTTMLDAPLDSSHASHSGTKLSLFTNDASAAIDSVVITLSTLVSSLLVGVFAFAYVLYVHWVIAAVAIALGLFSYIYSIYFAKWLHHIAVKMQTLLATQEERMKDLLDGMVIARLYGMINKLEAGMKKSSDDLMQEGIRWARASGLLGALNNATSHFTQRILIFIAGLYLVSGALSLPDLMRVSQMAGAIAGVFQLSRLLVALQRSLAGADRAFLVLDHTCPEPSGRKDSGNIAAPAISFSHVTFGYRSAQPIVQDLSFAVHPGEMVTLIGTSGSGKSTMLRLIQGLYYAQSGSVEVLGIPTTQWNVRSLRRQIMYVPQEPVLFPGTIAQNIAIGQEQPDLQKVQKAATLAGAQAFISSLPNGYDTLVSERGASLSGGQKQRIAIARAFYCDAPILLLDEATSAMDSESEAVVHEALLRLKGAKTILSVSHRASTMRLSDRTVRI